MPERIAVCPGTYDPVTVGHTDIIRRACEIFDHVVVGVVRQPRHKQTTLFSVDERIGFIRESVADVGNVEVEGFATLVVDFAREHGARAIVKGLRAVSDFEWEFQMNNLNRELAGEIETLYLMASPKYSFLSSRGVREIASFGGTVADYVPESVARALEQKFSSERTEN
jgi:pantetheine-phosphate adenylyltransferase